MADVIKNSVLPTEGGQGTAAQNAVTTATPTLEKQTRSAKLFTIILAASGTPGDTQGLSFYGNSFYIRACLGTVNISTEKTPQKPYRTGQGEKFIDELIFDRIEISNPNSYVVSVQIWVGFGEYIDKTFQVVEGYTVIVGWIARKVTAGQMVSFLGAPTGSNFQRKALLISNDDITNSLYVTDSAGNYAVTIKAGFQYNLPVAGPMIVRNDTAGDIAVSISEIYYVQGD